MRFLIVLIVLLVTFENVSSQAQWQEQQKDLAFYADVMVNAQDGSHRERAANAFNELISSVLKDPQSFNYSFDQIKWVSTMVPIDSAFRVISWQWQNRLETYDYAGVVQLNDGTNHWLRPLINEPSDLEYAEFSPDKWLGQVYYKIHQYNDGGETTYLLFGYRMSSGGTIIKTAEPISIAGGKPIFGKELFFDDKRHGKNRLVIRYSSSTSASLKYDEALDKIVFDNIVSIINPYESGAVRLVPEGTYKAYGLKSGKWKYEESILDTKYNTPPQQNTKTDEPKRDLFGR